MIITEEHIGLTLEHFQERRNFSNAPSANTNWFFWMLIKRFSDELFYQRVNLLIFQRQDDFWKKFHCRISGAFCSLA